MLPNCYLVFLKASFQVLMRNRVPFSSSVLDEDSITCLWRAGRQHHSHYCCLFYLIRVLHMNKFHFHQSSTHLSHVITQFLLFLSIKEKHEAAISA